MLIELRNQIRRMKTEREREGKNEVVQLAECYNRCIPIGRRRLKLYRDHCFSFRRLEFLSNLNAGLA